MDTMLIQLTNQKAAGLLHELEELHLIKVLKQNVQTKHKLSEKYAGKLPSDVADELQSYVTQSRNEWNNRNI
jgi:hypothetical protein